MAACLREAGASHCGPKPFGRRVVWRRQGADGARRLVVLEGTIERGEAGEQAITEAADILDDPTRARMLKSLEARRADDAARDRRIEKVSAVLAGRAPATGEGDGKPDGGGVKDEDLHPGAPEWRQAVDDHYASLAEALETMDPDMRARFEDDYARTTGVLPEPVLKQVRAGLLSADPAEQAAAAQRLARLKDGNPALVSAIPEDERRRAQAIAGFAGLGLPPARAVELAAEKPVQGFIASEDLSGRVEGGGAANTVGPKGETQVAMAQILPLFVEGTILLLGALGAGALGRQLQQDTENLLRERQKPGADTMQQTPPPPPMPDVEPPKMPEKTEFPAEPPDIPELPGFSMPEDRPNLIEIFPDMSGEFPQITIVKRRGGPRTRKLNTDVADLGRAINEEQGGLVDHVGGALDDKRIKLPETHLKGPDDAKPLRKGSFLDVTFQSRDTKRRLLINTISTNADRVTPSKREADAAARIIVNKNSADILILIPKLRKDDALDTGDFKKFLRPLFKEIARPADERTIENLPRLWNPKAR